MSGQYIPPTVVQLLTTRGYYAIGIEHTKTAENVGTLWRSADLLGAAFILWSKCKS